jgi:hypothetical protein
VKHVEEPLRSNIRGILPYLVDRGLTDEEMAADPFGAAVTIRVWDQKRLLASYGRVRGKLAPKQN